jgi:hypothetical protein
MSKYSACKFSKLLWCSVAALQGKELKDVLSSACRHHFASELQVEQFWLTV